MEFLIYDDRVWITHAWRGAKWGEGELTGTD